MSILDHGEDRDDDGSMFNPFRSGAWYLSSASDPRFNTNGRDSVGGFTMPEAAKQALKEKEALYGPRPSDLEYGYMKD
jgi:hypothetical protein